MLTVAYAVVYALFSALFYAVSGGDRIYDALHWSDPSGTVLLCALIIFVCMFILWSMLYCIVLVRLCYRVSTSSGNRAQVSTREDSGVSKV